MYALATTTIEVFRGDVTDQFGDATPDTGAQPVFSRLLAAISDNTHVVGDQSTQTPRVVRHIVGNVLSGTDIRVNDRIHDNVTGINYWVHDVVTQTQPGYGSDTELSLRKVT